MARLHPRACGRAGRIRWLLGAGLPLFAIGEILDATPASVVDDLRSTLAGIDEQILGLQEQRRGLRVLLDAAEQGHALTPMPDAAATCCARMGADAPPTSGPHARSEPRGTSWNWPATGGMPEGAELIFAHLDPATTAEALAACGRGLDAMDVSRSRRRPGTSSPAW